MKGGGKPYAGKLHVRFDQEALKTPNRYGPAVDECVEAFRSGSRPGPVLYSTQPYALGWSVQKLLLCFEAWEL